MRVFCLMRHAKSSRENPLWKDIERPLLAKGENRTRVISEMLLKKGISPNLILSSPATRALETARILAESLSLPNDIIAIEPDIYHGSEDDLLSLLKALPVHIKKVVMVGHNPHITGLCNRFLKYPIDNLTTSGIVAFGFEADSWDKLPASKPGYLFTLTEKN